MMTIKLIGKNQIHYSSLLKCPVVSNICFILYNNTQKYFQQINIRL